jgi:hypothetical protein
MSAAPLPASDLPGVSAGHAKHNEITVFRPGVRTPIRVGPRSQVIDVAAIGIVRRGQFPDPVHSGVLRLRSSSLPL